MGGDLDCATLRVIGLLVDCTYYSSTAIIQNLYFYIPPHCTRVVTDAAGKLRYSQRNASTEYREQGQQQQSISKAAHKTEDSRRLALWYERPRFEASQPCHLLLQVTTRQISKPPLIYTLEKTPTAKAGIGGRRFFGPTLIGSSILAV